jgi:chloramphenicol 3-O-phosphotransferase
MSIIFLSGPIGAGKTAVAKALLPLLPAPLSYIEGDTFWSAMTRINLAQGQRSYVTYRRKY